MKIFITTRSHNVNHSDIVIVDSLLPLLFFLEDVKNSSTPILAYDKEFNGLNELNAIPLITQIGNSEHQFAVDDVSFPNLSYLEPYKDLLYVGHNIKIDIKVARLQGINLRNVYDTMIAEQRLGLDSKRLNNLEATHERRLGTRMPFKDFGGKTFSTMNEKSIFENIHILYSLGDIQPLLNIKEIQKVYIEKFGMYDLIRDENRIIPIIADSELEGMNIDEVKWKDNIESNKLKLVELERQMDTILEELTLVKKRNPRSSVELIQTNLFGFPEQIRKIPIASRINYSSSDQVLELFDKLGYEKPIELNKDYEEVPSAGGPALQRYNLENPENELFDFIELLLKYKEADKELSSFGEKFLHSRILKKDGKYVIGYKNDKTGRVHTIYRQVETTTGRLASGESKVGYYNSQQIPAIKKYRHCFTLSKEELNGRAA